MIAAQTTARRIQAFFIMPLTATAAGVATFTSQNFGARKFHRIHEGVRKASYLAIAWSMIAMVTLYLLGPLLTQAISGSDNSVLLTASTTYLNWNTLFTLF